MRGGGAAPTGNQAKKWAAIHSRSGKVYDQILSLSGTFHFSFIFETFRTIFLPMSTLWKRPVATTTRTGRKTRSTNPLCWMQSGPLQEHLL